MRTIRARHPEAWGVWFFSPSQIDMFLRCPRSWAWRYLRGLKGPDKASAILGTVSHGVLEKYLETGGTLPFSDPDPLVAQAAEVVAPALIHLPAPGTPGLGIENEFVFQTGEIEHRGQKVPVYFLGYKDLRIPAEVSESGFPEVLDHKTTSDINRYSKSEDDLRNDSQAMVYAYDEMVQTGAEKVVLRWSYMQTRGARKTKQVKLPLVRDEVFPQMERIAYLAGKLLPTILESRDPAEFGCNTRACNDYGGCPYRDQCAPLLTEDEKVAGIMSNDQDFMDLLGKIEKSVPSIPGATPAAPKAAAPSSDLDDLLGAPVKPVTVSTPAPSTFGPINPPSTFGPINPPTSGTAATPAVAPEEAPTAKEPPVVEIAPAKPRGRGRPAGSYNKPKEKPAPVVEDSQQETLPGIESQAGPEDCAQAAGLDEVTNVVVDKDGFRLYVNCIPYGVDVTMGEEIFAEAQKRIQAKKGVPDYRFISFTGAGDFAEVLRGMLAEGYFAGMSIVLRNSSESQIAAGVLAPAAKFPVVGGLS